jgi:hypothetical protein
MTLVDTPIDPNYQDGAGNGNKPDKGKSDEDRSLFLAYGRLFADAFGRVLARSTDDKRDLRCIQNAFSPVLFSLRDALAESSEDADRSETDKFIAEYMGAMQKRATSWPVEPAAATYMTTACAAEFDRAIRALRVAVARETATRKAKEGVIQ